MRVNRIGTDRLFCIYSLSIDNHVFYIGKTQGRFRDRFHNHKNNNQRVLDYAKDRINEVKFNVLQTYDSKKTAEKIEILLIEMLAKDKIQLINYQHNTPRYVPLKWQKQIQYEDKIIKEADRLIKMVKSGKVRKAK